MRDLKDYITSAKDGVAPNPGSPFNIKEDSAVLSNFSQADVEKLFVQRAEETGQAIDRVALEYVWEQFRGQPWIVNSLFKRATMRVLQNDDYSTVTLAHIKEAREQMILARETHLDALASAYLVIFDRRPETKGKSWEERLSWGVENGITLIGC